MTRCHLEEETQNSHQYKLHMNTKTDTCSAGIWGMIDKLWAPQRQQTTAACAGEILYLFVCCLTFGLKTYQSTDSSFVCTRKIPSRSNFISESVPVCAVVLAFDLRKLQSAVFQHGCPVDVLLHLFLRQLPTVAWGVQGHRGRPVHPRPLHRDWSFERRADWAREGDISAFNCEDSLRWDDRQGDTWFRQRSVSSCNVMTYDRKGCRGNILWKCKYTDIEGQLS